MAMPASWTLPLALMTLLAGPAAAPGAAQSRPTEVRNSNSIRLVEIRGGGFDMGSTVGPGEAPVHRVSVRSFWMGVTEVTQAQWRAVMGTNPSHFKQAGPDAPVEMVGWDEVQVFIRKLNERDRDWRYRLPSEAEWEYACRAGTAKDPYGPAEAIAWIKENSNGTTHPVALKQPNALGLYDMFGNVPEWTQDTWHADYNGAPTDGSAWEGGGSPHHTLRGGGWDLPAFFLHAALRGPYGEIHRRGFRVAADRRQAGADRDPAQAKRGLR